MKHRWLDTKCLGECVDRRMKGYVSNLGLHNSELRDLYKSYTPTN
jgi:hypothetical protein